MLLSLELKSLVSTHKEEVGTYQKQISDLKDGKTKLFLIQMYHLQVQN